MNLQRRCRKCHVFFSVEPMELRFFCDKKECREYMDEYHFYTIKRNRCINMDYFDIWDLDRPRSITDKGIVIDYERVCRICGVPLFNKNGKYSVHRRYCGEHSGYELWVKYNWGEVSKKYAIKIREENQELIEEKYNQIIQKHYETHKEIPKWVKETNNLTICEECGKICQIYSQTFLYNILKLNIINIHHKIPVHTLIMKNLHLIWDYNNLIALCEDCHHKQDHYLKTKVDPYINFKKMTEYL